MEKIRNSGNGTEETPPYHEKKVYSHGEIKKKLKGNSKGDLINIIINLSKKIDEHKEHNEDIRNIVNDVNNDSGFSDYAFYSMIIGKVDEDV